MNEKYCKNWKNSYSLGQCLEKWKTSRQFITFLCNFHLLPTSQSLESVFTGNLVLKKPGCFVFFLIPIDSKKKKKNPQALL